MDSQFINDTGIEINKITESIQMLKNEETIFNDFIISKGVFEIIKRLPLIKPYGKVGTSNVALK